MFTDRMKSNIWWRCCVTATHWIAPPGTDAFAWYVCFLPQGSSQHFNIYIINLNWSGHSGVFWLLAHLPSQLLLHVVEVLAVFVPQAQQFNHVLCRIEGEVRLHHFKNPTKFSSDHLLFHTEADKSVPQMTKCWPLIFFSLLPTNILSPLVVFHSYNQWNNQNRNVIINPTLSLGWPATLPFSHPQSLSASQIQDVGSNCFFHHYCTSSPHRKNGTWTAHCRNTAPRLPPDPHSHPSHPTTLCASWSTSWHCCQTSCQRDNLWTQSFPIQCMSQSPLSNAYISNKYHNTGCP